MLLENVDSHAGSDDTDDADDDRDDGIGDDMDNCAGFLPVEALHLVQFLHSLGVLEDAEV